MDQWVQKLSLAVLLVVVVICLYGTNREISCQTPAHFTSVHSRYAHQACVKPDAATYPPITDWIPHHDDNATSPMWTSHIDNKSAWMLELALVQVIVICTAYCLIDWIVASGCVDAWSMHKELHKSYFKVPLYFLIQVVYGICWIAFTIVINQQNEFPTSLSTFMCDYKVRRIGNLQRYTVQCIDGDDYHIRAAFMINYGLALVVTLTKLFHIISVFLVGPFLGLKTARAVLMKSGAIQNPAQLGGEFAFSDLYFVMLISGKGSSLARHSAAGLNSFNGGQGEGNKDTELAHLGGKD